MAARGQSPATPRETEPEKLASSNGKAAEKGADHGAAKGQSSQEHARRQPSRDPVEGAPDLAGQVESAASKAAESIVGGSGFAGLLGMLTENVMAITRMGNDVADLALRNLRLAGRKDIARLGSQQARTEDKLETVLQEVLRLQAELRRAQSGSGGSGGMAKQ